MMADPKPSIFNMKATEKLRSPDDLDKYVRVTNPSVWTVLGACIVLVLGLLSWGVFGSVTTSVDVTGVCEDGEVLCFLTVDDARKVHEGDAAYVGGERMKVERIGSLPISRDEAKSVVNSDYLVSTLFKGDWCYVAYFEPYTRPDSNDADSSSSFNADGNAEDDSAADDRVFDENVPLSINITTELIAPISLVFGGNS